MNTVDDRNENEIARLKDLRPAAILPPAKIGTPYTVHQGDKGLSVSEAGLVVASKERFATSANSPEGRAIRANNDAIELDRASKAKDAADAEALQRQAQSEKDQFIAMIARMKPDPEPDDAIATIDRLILEARKYAGAL